MTDAEAREVVLLLEDLCFYVDQAKEACREMNTTCTTHAFRVVSKGVHWSIAVEVLGEREQDEDPHD